MLTSPVNIPETYSKETYVIEATLVRPTPRTSYHVSRVQPSANEHRVVDCGNNRGGYR